MEQQQNTSSHASASSRSAQSNRLDWLIFFVSFVAMMALLIIDDRFFWIMLPFASTYLVKALNML